MSEVLRVWGGSYHDYWFTEDAILKVRLVPQAITLVGIIILVVLTALFAIIGVIAGAVVAGLIYMMSGNLAKRRRRIVAGMQVQELQRRGLVTLRIPYAVISEAEIRGTRLVVSVEGRKVRVRIPPESLQRLQSMLRSKIADRFSVTAK